MRGRVHWQEKKEKIVRYENEGLDDPEDTDYTVKICKALQRSAMFCTAPQ